MTLEMYLTIQTLLIAFVAYQIGATVAERKAHNRFMKFVETSDINQWGEYE